MKKAVRKEKLSRFDEIEANLSYWLSRTPEERVSAVEILRRQVCGSTERLQRTARVFNDEGVENKRAIGRQKDLSDLEALGETGEEK